LFQILLLARLLIWGLATYLKAQSKNLQYISRYSIQLIPQYLGAAVIGDLRSLILGYAKQCLAAFNANRSSAHSSIMLFVSGSVESVGERGYHDLDIL